MTHEDRARCGPWLEAALAHAGGTHALADVWAMVTDGLAQAWASPNACLITVLEDDPRERRLLLWLAGGDLDELVKHLRPAAEAWGRRQGCRRALIIGRPGWERTLAPEGYAPLARIIAKEL